MLTTDAVHPVERYNRYRTFHRLSTFRVDPDLRQNDKDGDSERRFRHPDHRRPTDAKPPEADGQTDMRTAARRLVDVIHELFRLQTALVKLSAASPLSVWHVREAEAEPPDLVRVRAFRGATVAEYRIYVLRCAEAHTYISRSFSALAKIPENLVGVYEIELETKKGVFRRTIVAFPTDSATQLFVKITSALHETHAGIHCRIHRRTDADGAETVSLVVRAAETGRTGSFSLRDVKGDLLAQLGLDRPAAPAQDAEYLVNGSGPFTSGVNRIELGQPQRRRRMEPLIRSKHLGSRRPYSARPRRRFSPARNGRRNLQSVPADRRAAAQASGRIRPDDLRRHRWKKRRHSGMGNRPGSRR